MSTEDKGLYRLEWISLGSLRGFSSVPWRRGRPRPEKSEGAGIRLTDPEDCAPTYSISLLTDEEANVNVSSLKAAVVVVLVVVVAQVV